jgi:group I intron endonuclease
MARTMTGVYSIAHKQNGRRYIGSARVSLLRRKREHFRRLDRGDHPSPLIQRDFDRDGIQAFEFTVLVYCEVFECLRYEQFFIDKARGQGLLYNATPYASWVFGDRGRGRRFSPHEAHLEDQSYKDYNALVHALISEGISPARAHEMALRIFPPYFAKPESPDPDS